MCILLCPHIKKERIGKADRNIGFIGSDGLILPSLLRMKPKLTSWAAVGSITLMIGAAVFHIVRGEASQIGVNIVFLIMAAFVALGRFRNVAICRDGIEQDLLQQ